jgi:two-component system OmpR family response regulator
MRGNKSEKMTKSLKRIFIVDDDEMLTMMLEDYLNQMRRYTVQSFATGEECLAQLHQNPDAIILDFNLDSIHPNAMNGLEILKQVKKEHRGIQVIMYSSQKQYGKALQTIGEGAIEYIIKDNDTFTKIDTILRSL